MIIENSLPKSARREIIKGFCRAFSGKNARNEMTVKSSKYRGFMGNIRIYSEGLSSPKRDGAAWAFVVFEGEKEIYSDKGLIDGSVTAGSVAEYTALENALLYIDRHLPDEKVNLYVDSRFVLYQTRGKWNAHAAHLIPFRNRCQSLYRENPKVRLYYCKPEENKADAYVQEICRRPTDR